MAYENLIRDELARRNAQPQYSLETQRPDAQFGGTQNAPLSFGRSFSGGVQEFKGGIKFAGAMLQDMFGEADQALIDSALRDMREGQDIAAGAPTFHDVLDSGTPGVLRDWAVTTLGRLGPDIIEGMASATIGAALGAAAAGPVGAAGGAAEGLAMRTTMKTMLTKELRDSLERVAKGRGTGLDQNILDNTLRATMAQRGALYAATAGGYPRSAGEAYRESHEAGDPSPWGAAAIGGGMAALDAVAANQAFEVVGGLFKQSGRLGTDLARQAPSLLAQTGRKVGKATVAEGGTEAAQEELLIQFRDYLQPGYASTEEARHRRIESAAAGALAGAARGAAIDAPIDMLQGAGRNVVEGRSPLDDGTTPPADGTPGAPTPDAGPSLRERADAFASRFDPVVDDRGYVVNTRRPQPEPQAQPQAQPQAAPDDAGVVMPEGQADVDAQFRAAMDPNNPKRGVEVNSASPAPTGLADAADVYSARTRNGTFYTRDPELAQRVEQEGGSDAMMAEALGYGRSKQDIAPDRAMAAAVRDENNAVIHSEVIDRDDQPAAAERLKNYGGRVEFTSLEQHLADREARANARKTTQRRFDLRNGPARQQAQPAPRQDFTPEPAQPQVQPAPRQDFTPEPEQQAAQPAPRQDFTPEPEQQAAQPAPRQDFTPEPAQSQAQPAPRQDFTPEPAQSQAQPAPGRKFDLRNGPARQQAQPAPRQDFTPEPAQSQAQPAPRQDFTPAPEQPAAQPAPARKFDLRNGPARQQAQPAPRQDFTPEPAQPQAQPAPRQDFDPAVGSEPRDMKLTGRERPASREDFQDPDLAQDASDARLDQAINDIFLDRQGVDRDADGRALVYDVFTPEPQGTRPVTAMAEGAMIDEVNPGAGRSAGIQTRPQQLDPTALTRRDKGYDMRARSAPVQNLGWRPVTENMATTLITTPQGDQHLVPTAMVKQAQELQQRFPNDEFTFANKRENGAEHYALVRRRDPTEAERDSAFHAQDGTVQGTTERVMNALDRGRWTGREEPRNDNAKRYTLRMTGPNGQSIWVNPKVLAAAGMDVSQGLGGNTTAQRSRTGLATALAVLDDSGYRIAAWAPNTEASPALQQATSFVQFKNIYGLPFSVMGPRIAEIRLRDSDAITEQQRVLLLSHLSAIPTRRNKEGNLAWTQDTLKRFRRSRKMLHDQGITMPSEYEQNEAGDILLAPGLHGAIEIVTDTDIAWPSDQARALWEDMNADQRTALIHEYGDAVSLVQLDTVIDGPIDHVPNDVIAALNEQAKHEWFLAEQEGGVDTRERKIESRGSTATPRETRRLKETSHDTFVDESLPTWVADVTHLARRVTNLRQRVLVATDTTSMEDLNEAMSENGHLHMERTPAIRQSLEDTLAGKRSAAGTTIHVGDTSVIFLRSLTDANGRPRTDAMAMVMTHELGHVAYRDHLNTLIKDKRRFNTLYRAYEKDRREGLVHQYEDPKTGFEEWVADRYSSWMHRRVRSNQAMVAKAGAFAELRTKLRGLFDGVKRQMTALVKKGEMALPTRMKGNKSADSFFDTLAQTSELQERVMRLERETTTGRNRFNADAHAELREARRELHSLRKQAWDGAGVEASREQFEQAVETAQKARARRDAQQAARDAQKTARERNAQAREAMLRADQQQDWLAGLVDDGQRPPRTDGIPQGDLDGLQIVRQMAQRARERGQQARRMPVVPNQPGLPVADPLTESVADIVADNAGSSWFTRSQQWVNDRSPRFLKTGARALRDIVYTDDSRLRQMGPRGARIAGMFWSAPGTRRDATTAGYMNRRESETADWLRKFDQAIPDNERRAEQVMALVQREVPRDQLPQDALPLFDLMTELGQHLETHVNGFNSKSVYGTRVYNVSEMMARPEEFKALIMKADSSIDTASADSIFMAITQQGGQVELQTADQAGAGPGLNAKAARVLTNVSNADLQAGKFLETPKSSFVMHIRSAIHRAEFERAFGAERDGKAVVEDLEYRRSQGQPIDEDYLAKLKHRVETSQDPVMVYDPAAKVKNEIDQLEGQDQVLAREIVENYMGRSNRLFGKQLPPKVGRGLSAVGAYVYMTTLGLASISQVTDLATTAMRMHSTSAFKDLYQTLTQFTREERAELARRVGTVQSQMTMDALHNSYGNDFMTPEVRWATDVFFKITGLQAITDHNRALATQMGLGFITRATRKANEGDATAIRQLQDLGLTPQDVSAFYSEGQNFDTPAGEKLRQGLYAFVDESILRPNAAMRPGWASNPWFSLFWQLKSFAWGGKKIFIDGVAREYTQRRREGQSILASTASAQVGIAMGLPLAFAAVMLRDMAKEGLNSTFDDDEYDWRAFDTDWASGGGITELVDRAGLLGPLSLAVGAYSGMDYGRPVGVSLAGPAAERAYSLVQGEYGRVGRDSIPLLGLVL
ncbi:hypothetical protein [Celeribacter sp.]|uniref:hypothetical protein n=1 Tax=Celeribacter sp. TaxID=1890673 RepID=UPI003A91DAE1